MTDQPAIPGTIGRYLQSRPALAAAGALLLLVVGCLAADFWLERKLRADIAATLQTVRDTANESARAWIEHHTHLLAVWTSAADNARHVRIALGADPNNSAGAIGSSKNRIAADLYRHKVAEDYIDFFVVGRDARTRITSDLDELDQITFVPGNDRFLAAAWEGEQTVEFSFAPAFEQLHDTHSPLSTRVVMYVATPVRNESDAVVAVVVVAINPENGLVPVLERGRMKNSGETFIFNRQGRLLIGGRFGSDANADAPILAPMAARLASRQDGVDLEGYVGDRGKPVMSAWRWNAAYGFGLATEIAKDEAYVMNGNIRLIIVLLGGVAAVLMIGLSAFFVRWRQDVKESDDLYRDIIDTASAGFLIFDLPTERIVDVNQTMCEYLGYDRQELIGRNPIEFTADSSADKAAEKMRDAKSTKHRQFEIQFVTRDGHRIDMEVHATTQFDSANRAARSVGFFTDISARKATERQLDAYRIELEAQVAERTKELTAEITEREKAEQALRKSEEFYRALYTNASSGICVADTQARFIQVNDGWVNLTGYSASECLNKSAAQLAHPDDREMSEKWFRRLLSGEIESYTIEVRVIAKNGETVWVDLRVSPIKDDDGNIVATMAVGTDITDRKRTTQELYKKTTLWAQAERTAHLGHWYWEVGVAHVEWSDEIYRIHGSMPGAYVIGADEGFKNFFPDDRDLVRRSLKQAMRDRSDFEFECRIVRADGGTRHVVIKGKCELGASGRVSAMFGVMQDVTDRVLAEAELARQKMQLDALLNSMPQGVLNWDENNRLRLWNQAYLDMRGLQAGDLYPGMPIKDLVTLIADQDGLGEGERMDLIGRQVHRLTASPMPDIEEITTADGSIYELTHVPYPGGGVTTIFNNVTERRRAEQSVQEEKERAELYLKVASAIILVIDRSGIIVRVNDEGRNVLGYEEHEMVGQNWFTTFLPPEVREKALRKLKTTVDAEEDPMPSAITNVICKSGERRAILWRIQAVRDGRGRILNILSSGLDITESQKAETALRMAKEEAEYANRAKSEFLANMSHELRTPLNAVLGFSEIIRDEMFGPLGSAHYKEYASDIHASGEHLLGIINDILDLAKIEAGQVELQEERFDLQSIVEPCIRLMRERAEKARVTIQPPEINCSCELWGDKRKFKQILLNLLSNAIKFTDAGGSVAIKAALDDTGALVMSVSDTGIGIEQEDLSKVLAPFSQVNSSLTRNHDGTGLGLPLVKSLCVLHGGSLWLDSEVDVGTTATINIPASRVFATDMAAPAHATN